DLSGITANTQAKLYLDLLGFGSLGSSVVISGVQLVGANQPPTAVNDAKSTGEDSVLVASAAVGVLANDTDPDAGDTKVVVAVNGQAAAVGTQITLPSGARLTVNGDGSYQYDPNGKFESLKQGATATDSFNYTMADGSGATSSASVTITIQGANDPPVAK